MKKIIDQYTNRKDLTSWQKWNLRHPGKNSENVKRYQQQHRDKTRQWTRNWKANNPEKYEASYTRWNRKVRLREINAEMEDKKKAVTWCNGRGSAKAKEILRLHAKGKAIVDIAIWLNVPMSAVSETISRHQNETPQRCRICNAESP